MHSPTSSFALLSAVLERYRLRITSHDPGTRSGDDPEDLHKMRTSTRRLRADLRLCRGVLKKKRTRALRAELKWLAGVLGVVRDLDVMLLELPRHRQSLPEIPAERFEAFAAMLKQQRTHARAPLLEALDSERYRRLLEELERAADPRRLGKHAARPALDLLGPRLLATTERLGREARAIHPDSPDEQLHRLRIRVKKLRYGCELAKPLLPAEAGLTIKGIKAWQDLLGAHQDSWVAGAWVRRFAQQRQALDAVEHERWQAALAAERSLLRRRFFDELPAFLDALGSPEAPAAGSLAAHLGA